MIRWFRRKKEDAPAQEPPVEREEAAEVPEGEQEPAGRDAVEMCEDERGREAAEAAAGHEEPEEAPSEETTESAGEIPEESAEEAEESAQRGRFFSRLRERLHRSRERLADRVDRLVLGKKTIDADVMDDLEEILITSDLGVQATQLLLERVSDRVKRKELQDPARLREALREEIARILSVDAPPFDPAAAKPFVIMVIGVNGVGKTTTIGKLARRIKTSGLSPLLVAGDTFRAAAIEQLERWGERIDVPVIRQKSGADPSAVAFDALDAAQARKADVVIVDTAGRMHTKVNLMEELKKVHRVIQKKMPTAPHEILLVLDATTGQNAISQARLFREAMNITGLILTKLDGTAKGGVIVPICHELKLPVRFIGIGEGMDDLRPFDPREFAEALL
ncbi:signal recognition particle-docking protein FtsY [Desulfacinum infernum DSM 9756]|uniref:Signal recognition particle receptor FtsY n=1 Tax=Desulfacinum infernum DSM 9756 TaxID=1121391 RepID=A0A1M5ADZ4_9BACT|nr:signal recognition particle-docking protein FtsY [Desulfacinum infernum]SHF28498.1 signal recognition particle-docking protein FtsY [Desulfacinum infernum DSM 9756]